MPQHRLSAEERERAMRRVSAEGKVPLTELAKVADEPPHALRRYIVEGWRGIHLEGVSDPNLGWCSSHKALLRFWRRRRVRERLETGPKGGGIGMRAAG